MEAYRGLVVHGKDIMDVSLDNGCFSRPEVTYDQDFVQVFLDLWIRLRESRDNVRNAWS